MKFTTSFSGGLFLLLLLATTACGNRDLHSASLKVAVVGQDYYESFYVEDEGWNWDTDGTVLAITSGSLPPGLYLTSGGEIIGSPTTVGLYAFRITAYTFDDSWDDEDDVDTDSESYNLYVTEASSNPDCPNPGDDTITETYLCLGELTEESLASGDTVTYDVTFFTSFEQAGTYNIHTIDFTIFYDPTVFQPTATLLNSQALREAATWFDGTVDFTEVAEGELRVTITNNGTAFHRAGRLLDLSFTALTDVPAGEYPFTVSVNQLLNGDGASAETNLYLIDGMISVTTGSESH